MFDLTVNPLAVLATSIVVFLISLLWNSKYAFGKIINPSAGKIDKDSKPIDVKRYAIVFVLYVFMTYVLAYVIKSLQIEEVLIGISTSIILCIGFVATILIQNRELDKNTWKSLLIHILHYLVIFIVTGWIITWWK